MARYIEANDLVRKMTLQANKSSLGGIAPPSLSYSEMLEIIADAPTADVVPKREVFLASSDAMKMLIECHGYALTHDADIKKEVAREIFEDIDKKIGIGHDVIDIFNILAELKKKYTEGKE